MEENKQEEEKTQGVFGSAKSGRPVTRKGQELI